MGLLDNKRQDIYYTGGSQVFYQAPALLSSSNNQFNITNLEFEFGSKITTSDIRVYIESGDEDFTDIEVLDFTVDSSNLRLSTVGDAALAFQSLSELNAEGVVRVEIIDHAFGGYRHTSLADVVSNFMFGYVGEDKIINYANKSDVLFHARRGLQEFSFDVLKTVKSQEVELGPSLSIPMPQDYVSYVKICYIDENGIKKIIYPTTLTTNPTEAPAQDTDYGYIFNSDGKLLKLDPITEDRWQSFNTDNITGFVDSDEDYFVHRDDYSRTNFGRRYGIEPEHQQVNGYFTINERTGSFNFSSDLSGKLIVVEYISDSLGSDSEMKIHKFAEEALYKHIAFNIIAAKRGMPEYIVQRFKKERRAAMRTAKLRLSKINLAEISQVLRGQSKRIKN
jgi:hypothetical protein